MQRHALQPDSKARTYWTICLIMTLHHMTLAVTQTAKATLKAQITTARYQPQHTTTPKRHFLWEEPDTAVDYEPAEVLATRDDAVDRSYNSMSEYEATSYNPALQDSKVTTDDLDWLTTFNAVCHNRSKVQPEANRELADSLSCADKRRTVPFECRKLSEENIRCACTTLYGVASIDPNGNYVYEAFLVRTNDATVATVLAAAKRCSPDFLSLELILQYNSTDTERHDATVLREASWLKQQLRVWLAELDVTTFEVESSASFEYLGAVAVNSPQCVGKAWFTRWKIALRVNSALFESQLSNLLLFVRTKTSHILMHNHAHTVLQICIQPRQYYDISSAQTFHFCAYESLGDIPKKFKFNQVLCAEYVPPPRSSNISNVGLTQSTELTTATIERNLHYDDDETLDASGWQLDWNSLHTTNVYSLANRRTGLAEEKIQIIYKASGNLSFSLPTWLVLILVLIASLCVGLTCTVVTLYVRRRRKNKGSYKVELDVNSSKRKSVHNSPACIFATHTDAIACKADTLVSLNDPVAHDYSNGPPAAEFFA